MKLKFKNGLFLIGVFVFVFCLFGISKVNAAADIAVASSRITSANTVVVTFVDPGHTLASVDSSKWHIDVVDGGGASLTPESAVVTAAGTPWTVTLTFAGTPFSDTSKAYSAATGLYVDASGVTDSNGDTNAVVGHAASTEITDGQAPVITTVSYQDTDFDGKIDSVIVAYSETVVAGSVLGANDLSLTNVGDFTGAAFGSLATDLITGSVANTTVPLGTEATAKDTGDASGTLALSTQNLFSLVDAAGNTNATLGAQTQATFVDLAKPQIRSITYQDADADSKMDRLDVIYTEPVVAGSNLDTNDLIFTAVGSFTGAALGADLTDLITMTVSSTWVPLGTEASVVATYDALGTLAISSQNTFSLLDAAGNNNTTLGAQTQATFTDGIKPIVSSTTPVDSSTSQSKTNPLVVVFSEPMATGSVDFTMNPSNVSHTPAWTVSDTTLTLSHLNYSGSTVYTATLTGATDVATNTLAILPATTYSWSFTTAVSSSSGSGSSSSSSNNNSSNTITPTTPIISVTPVTPDITPVVCSVGQLFSKTSGKACTQFTPTTPATPATPAVGNSYAFGTTLVKMGTKGTACKAWQMFLNDKANAGLVTDGWCGKNTITKAKLWQASVGLMADGFLGPASRAKASIQ